MDTWMQELEQAKVIPVVKISSADKAPGLAKALLQGGMKIIELEDSFQMCTKEEYYDFLVAMALQPKKAVLSDVMLETLSIIAYKQPVTKLEIEKIRGVKSDHAVNKLIEYGLVREVGRLDAPGRPILFGTTEEFLRNFGVQGLDDLPEIDPVQMEDFKAEAEEEIQLQLDV